MTAFRIATRSSRLAMRQSQLVADALAACHEDLSVELVAMTTRGDRHVGPLARAGGKGLFTRELEQALLAGQVQAAVHSAKDLPAEMPPAFAIAAVPARADPRDVLVSRFPGVEALPAGATVGTGSPRRGAQLLALRGDLTIVAVRGNVETRLGKALAATGGLDAVVLAMAGLVRGGLAERHAGAIHPLGIEQVLPAGGQGTLAVQTLRSDASSSARLAPLEDAVSRAALSAERHVVRGLSADCHSCLAVHVSSSSSGWMARGMVARPSGRGMIRSSFSAGTAEQAAEGLLVDLLAHGAAELLSPGG